MRFSSMRSKRMHESRDSGGRLVELSALVPQYRVRAAEGASARPKPIVSSTIAFKDETSRPRRQGLCDRPMTGGRRLAWPPLAPLRPLAPDQVGGQALPARGEVSWVLIAPALCAGGSIPLERKATKMPHWGREGALMDLHCEPVGWSNTSSTGSLTQPPSPCRDGISASRRRIE